MSNSYNGYSWKIREAIIPEFRRATGGKLEGQPCAMCSDPDRDPAEWHSEDYSKPYTFEPPQTYPICKACHLQLHKRFNAPEGEWELFCLHIEAGGYGSEFVKLRSLAERRNLQAAVKAGTLHALPIIRARPPGPHWWRDLTLDKESLEAPWARPRPLRCRPNADRFLGALVTVRPSEKERELLRAHVNAPRRTATMRQLAEAAIGRPDYGTANLLYGRLAHRLVDALGWEPDKRDDGSPSWMSLVAEGWYPPGREFEWTMVPTAAEAVREWLSER